MKKKKTKPRKSVVKRFKMTKTGKLLHRSHDLRHKRAGKSKSRIRRLKSMKLVKGKFATKVKQMLKKA
ncbi:MAG: 50S ribosomal protein L35 [bacterium]